MGRRGEICATDGALCVHANIVALASSPDVSTLMWIYR